MNQFTLNKTSRHLLVFYFIEVIMNKTVAKWEKTRLLSRLHESGWELAANALEAQVQYNESELLDDEDVTQFKRTSVPMVVRALMGGFPNSGELQTQVNMKTESTFNKDDVVWYPTNINYRGLVEKSAGGNLDQEAEWTATSAQKLIEAIKTVANFGEPEESVYFYGIALDENHNVCIRYRLGK